LKIESEMAYLFSKWDVYFILILKTGNENEGRILTFFDLEKEEEFIPIIICSLF
jgi:hypothetical protein